MKYSDMLKSIVEDSYSLLNQLSSGQMSDKPHPDKWSSKEIIGHMIDSAINNHRRLLLSEKKGDLLFDGYDQDQWVRRNNYQNRSKKDLLDLWRLSNLHLADAINTLDDDLLERMTKDHNFDQISMISFDKGKSSNLNYLIQDYIYHIEHHLVQILPTYERVLGFNETGYVVL